jgi:16S rRNA (adenine1518-N6/adenine1519-N6)-dimethyltransferase
LVSRGSCGIALFINLRYLKAVSEVLPADLKAWTKAVAARYGLLAGQRMGQHFLVDKKVLQDIIATAQLTPETKVLEVGGGIGVLTLALLPLVKKLVVAELDKNMLKALHKIGLGSDKFNLIRGDIIKVPGSALRQALQLAAGEKFAIVANLPYEITGACLQKFLWGDLLPDAMTLIVQREVAERMAARPGRLSLLGLSCQLKSQVRIVRHVSPQSFWPEPRVQSSLVRLDLYDETSLQKKLAGQSIESIWRLARIGFAARRKVLLNNLVSALPISRPDMLQALRQVGLAPTVRAQELAIGQWVALAAVLQKNMRKTV